MPQITTEKQELNVSKRPRRPHTHNFSHVWPGYRARCLTTSCTDFYAAVPQKRYLQMREEITPCLWSRVSLNRDRPLWATNNNQTTCVLLEVKWVRQEARRTDRQKKLKVAHALGEWRNFNAIATSLKNVKRSTWSIYFAVVVVVAPELKRVFQVE